jgi:predicted porin
MAYTMMSYPTRTATIGLIVPFGGAGASSGASAASARLAATASTADNFLDAGSTQNGTAGVVYSMPVMDGLTFGAGIKVGHTETEKGDSTDLVGAKSYDYNELKVGVKYVTGDLTFNVGAAHTDTSDPVGAGSSDSVTSTYASMSYAIASGVSAHLDFTTNETEYGAQINDRSAWYIGANMAF